MITHKITDYFEIEELVDPTTCNELGHNAWQMFDKKLLDVLLWIREGLGQPMYANNWRGYQRHYGEMFKWRGYRSPKCTEGAQKSAHREWKALDFDVKGMAADKVREWIRIHIDACPQKIRLESGVNWVHVDVRTISNNKLTEFTA
jgi:hypothetical protein